MRVRSQKVALLVIVSCIACHDATGPVTVSAEYTLANIDGRPVPTYLAATPGPTATIISSTLTLNSTGKAVMTEHRSDVFEGERTYTNTYDYRIDGDHIEIGSFKLCAPNAICVPNKIGTISSDGLTLVINPASELQIITYNYRIALTL
jgi:hypothetical protein